MESDEYKKLLEVCRLARKFKNDFCCDCSADCEWRGHGADFRYFKWSGRVYISQCTEGKMSVTQACTFSTRKATEELVMAKRELTGSKGDTYPVPSDAYVFNDMFEQAKEMAKSWSRDVGDCNEFKTTLKIVEYLGSDGKFLGKE